MRDFFISLQKVDFIQENFTSFYRMLFIPINNMKNLLFFFSYIYIYANFKDIISLYFVGKFFYQQPFITRSFNVYSIYIVFILLTNPLK